MDHDSTTLVTAEHVIAILREHAEELRAAGILHASLFGSVARGDNVAESDVDVAVVLDPAAKIGFGIVSLEERVAALVGCPVDLVPEPVEKPRLAANIERDRQRAF